MLNILLQGYAYTFITEDQARYAGDIIKALELSGTTVPPELEKLWTDFKDQQKAVSYPFYSCWFQIAYLNPVYVCKEQFLELVCSTNIFYCLNDG